MPKVSLTVSSLTVDNVEVKRNTIQDVYKKDEQSVQFKLMTKSQAGSTTWYETFIFDSEDERDRAFSMILRWLEMETEGD